MVMIDWLTTVKVPVEELLAEVCFLIATSLAKIVYFDGTGSVMI